MNERGELLHLSYRVWYVNMTWHVYGSADNEKAACKWRDQGDQWGHMLGVEFRCQVIQGRTLRELEGTKGQQVECYVEAQDGRSWTSRVGWGRLGLVGAGYVRSVSKRPEMIWTFPERQSAIIRRVWGARLVSWCVGGPWLLLLVASRRVLKVKWYY